MKSLLALLLSIPLVAACSSSTTVNSSSCKNIAGTWNVSGACGPDICVITQNNCSTNFACSQGSVSYAGSVSGSSVTYAGKASTGVDATCSGTVDGNGTSMVGTCSGGGTSCGFSASKQ